MHNTQILIQTTRLLLFLFASTLKSLKHQKRVKSRTPYNAMVAFMALILEVDDTECHLVIQAYIHHHRRSLSRLFSLCISPMQGIPLLRVILKDKPAGRLRTHSNINREKRPNAFDGETCQ